MSNQLYTTPWRGTVQMKLTGGSTAGDAIGTQYTIPAASVDPWRNDNKVSPGEINAASYESLEYSGMITSGMTISTIAKTNSFLTANLLNELVFNLDTLYRSNQWAIKLDDKFAPDVYDGCYCTGFIISQAFDPSTEQPGPIVILLSFKCLYPTNENPSGPTSFTSGGTDAGQLTNCQQIDFGSSPTANMVRAYTITAGRVQNYVPGFNGTPYFSGIASGGFGGAVSLVQSPSYDETFGTAGTIRIGQSGAGIIFSFLTSHMEMRKPMTTAVGNKLQTWACRDLSAGGNPMAVTAW